MINTPRIIFCALLLCISNKTIIADKTPPSQNIKKHSLSHKIIDSVINTQLQKTLLTLTTNNLTPNISKKEATHLLLAAMDEAHTLPILDFLVKSFKQSKTKFDSHKIMLRGLEAPISIVKYLLENHIYNKDYLNKEQHYNFIFKLDKYHIGYILLIDSFHIKLLPSLITNIWGIISSFKFFIWLLSFISTTCDNLTQWINGYTGKLDFIFSLKGFLLFYLIRILYTLYTSIKVSIKPNYIFHLFTENFKHKPKKEIEDTLILLIEHGANINTKALLVEEQQQLMTLMQLPKGFNFYSYHTVSILHLAAEHDMYRLVQVLLEKRANINAISLSTKDKLNLPTKNKKTTTSLPFQFVTSRDIYHQKGLKQTPLDLAPPNSKSAQYLKQHGGKHYHKIKSSKKNKK